MGPHLGPAGTSLSEGTTEWPPEKSSIKPREKQAGTHKDKTNKRGERRERAQEGEGVERLGRQKTESARGRRATR